MAERPGFISLPRCDATLRSNESARYEAVYFALLRTA
jgi:hypothetical protein